MPTYNASSTMAEFHADNSFVRMLLGAIGSGKSVACCMEVLARAYAQKPNKQGVRKTRWCVIRNTYPELRDTTMKTWMDWIPPSLGVYRKQDNSFNMRANLGDGTSIEMEVLFRALDKPNDVKKLLSLELTGAWINEAREIPRQILDMLVGRIGRFPSMRDGGASWFGVIIDTNPPDEDHWIYKQFEELHPEGWKKFHQPSGIGPEAENIENLPKNYYKNMMAGKDEEWINVYCRGKYGFVSDGKPVYPEFNDRIHYNEDICHITDLPVYIGLDFGLTPAAVFIQQMADGGFHVIDELIGTDIAADAFADEIRRLMNKNKYTFEEGWGDPAGDFRAQTDANTPFMVMDTHGVPLTPAPTNDPAIRRDAVAHNLSTLTFTGQPRLMLGPKCKFLRKAFNGGYKYKRMQISNSEIYADKPDKGMYSHVSDALQYGLLGLGEGDALMFGDHTLEKVRVIPGLNYR